MTEGKKQNVEQNKSGSSILRSLSKLSSWIRNKSRTGFFGKIFNGYTKTNQNMQEGLTASLLGNSSKVAIFIRKIRLLISEQFEESKILKGANRLTKFFLGCKLRLYSAFLMTFGIYTGLVYFLKRFIMIHEDASDSLVIFSSVAFLLSLPILFSKKNLAEALISSKTGNFIVCDVLGFTDERLNIKTSKRGSAYNLAIFMGIIAGTLSYFIDPAYIIIFLLLFSFISLIVIFPEIGVIIAVMLIPLTSYGHNEAILRFIVVLYVVGYFIKLLRGKRVINFEITDLVVFTFGLLIIINSVDAETSSNMIMFLIGAFFGGKLLRTKIWQQRCLLAFSFSSFVISMIVIWQKISELSQTIDKGSFMIFERGEIPLFDGSVTMLSSFLMISLILTFGMMYSAKGSKQKTVLLLNSILLVGALALLQCIPVGFCGSIALISFFFIMSDKTLPVLLIGSAVTASGTLLIPVTVKKELASTILSLDSLGVYSIINIWDSSLELLKASSFMGVGIGGFSKLYPIYALAGTENVSNCGSLWIRLIGELGIIGIVVFMIILFLYAQNCSEYLRKPLNRASKACVAAGLSCVVLLCIVALIYDIFRNNCMFYIFWMMISVVSAKIKCDRGEIEKNTGYSINSEYAASVNL